MLTIFTKLADWIVYQQIKLDANLPAARALHFFIEDTTKIFSLLIIIIFFISLLRSGLQVEKVKGWLEHRGIGIAHILATIFGAITPFCSCSSVPLFIGFLEAGIPLGATMSFLITSPLINEIAVILLIGAVGMELTLVYIGIGLSIGFLGGILIHWIGLEHLVHEYVYQIKAIHPLREVPLLTAKEIWLEKIRYGREQVREILRRIWLYVMLGVGLGAMIHGYIPQQWLLEYAGDNNPLAVPLAVLIGIPLYANVSGTIPIAEALLGKGVQPGTVIALMMSISALSLPELIILKKVFKTKMLLIFSAILGAAFIMTGYLLNWIYS